MINNNILNIIEYSKNLVLLYVEDDETIANSAIKIFNKFFDKIIYAKDGIDGINKFNENHIDLIITDINMPKLNGLDMLKEIRVLDKTTPSIIISAHNEIEYYKGAIDLNVKGYLLKPLALNDIVKLLSKVVDEKKDEDIKTNKFNYLVDANKKLIDIGYQISTQKNHQKLLEIILLGAKDLSNSDGGTLYLFNKKDKSLEFKIILNSSLDIHHGGSEDPINWPALNLYNIDETVNKRNVAVVCAIEDKLVNINDIYQSTSYDFNGAKKFDLSNNYKTTSMLVIPMKNRDNELIGVIQLINKHNDNNEVISFNNNDESLITSMASQATMMLENNQLVNDLETLLYSLIKSIGSALSEKSQYTAKHIDNVAKLSEIIAKGINDNKTIYKDIKFSKHELEEIKLSALLHDIGKISTPEHIVDKTSKLETIYDRIKTIKLRFELVKKDIEILYLNNEISSEMKNEKILEIDDDYNFIEMINDGDTLMLNDSIERLNKIVNKYTIKINDKVKKVIKDNEFHNLSITKGTLTKADREIINNHVIITYNMLKEVPFPNKFANVPKIAGSHHKTIDGHGYAAKELLGIELTLQDKILVIADIFEALSALDRPYRGPNTLNQIAHIFLNMVKNRDLDKELVKIFFEDNLYLEYANQHLAPSQIDEITVCFDF